MGFGDFFKGVNTTMEKWGGTFYMGMFVLTILMMVLLFSWLTSKDAKNSLIIGTAVLLFIPAFVFLTLWMSSVYKFSPLRQLKEKLADAIFKQKSEIVAAFLASVSPEVAAEAVQIVSDKHGTEAANRAQRMVDRIMVNEVADEKEESYY